MARYAYFQCFRIPRLILGSFIFVFMNWLFYRIYFYQKNAKIPSKDQESIHSLCRCLIIEKLMFQLKFQVLPNDHLFIYFLILKTQLRLLLFFINNAAHIHG